MNKKHKVPGTDQWITEMQIFEMVSKIEDKSKLSDGYHTIEELYEHRYALFSALCGLAKATDERVIDQGIIRGSAKGVMKTGGYIRKIQTGIVENYALYSLLGAIIIIIISIVVAGVIPL